jgi:hypothetical protein
MPANAIAWDGTGEDPNLPRPTRRRAENASRIVEQLPTANEQDATADPDRNLASKLVICSGCLKPAETTGSPDASRVAYR